MAVLQVVTWPAKVLETSAAEVTVFDGELAKVAADMHETMRVSGGVGLAANQVGLLLRVVTAFIPWSEPGEGEESEPREVWHDTPLTFVNPVIVRKAGKVRWQEGCLSFPGIYEFVERSAEVTVKALDAQGKPFEMQTRGLLAICMQHEVDHLDGIVFINRMSRLKAAFIRKKIMRQVPSESSLEA